MNAPPIDAEITEQSQALTVRPEQAVETVGLFGALEPSQIISKATEIATALRDVLERQGLVSTISGKKYPKCEAWTLLGTMLGVFPVLEWSRPVEGGWEARVEARTKNGAVVGAAEAECLRTERNWSNRDDFALRSMAQTRATAKCLRMPLGFVMTLAGYQPTPAEEMGADHSEPPRPPQEQPQRPRGSPATPQTASSAPTPKSGGNPAPVVTFPTEASRAKMIAKLKAGPGETNRDTTTAYFRQLRDPTPLAPFEELEELKLIFVPATEGQMKVLAEKLSEFGNGEQISWAFPPHREPGKAPPKPKAEPDPAPAPTEAPAEGNCLRGKIAHVTLKHGSSKRGPWTLYGVKVGGEWANTFSATIGEAAGEAAGADEEVAVFFTETDKGKTITALVLADGTRIESET